MHLYSALSWRSVVDSLYHSEKKLFFRQYHAKTTWITYPVRKIKISGEIITSDNPGFTFVRVLMFLVENPLPNNANFIKALKGWTIAISFIKIGKFHPVKRTDLKSVHHRRIIYFVQ